MTAVIDPAELDPMQKPFWGLGELHRVGFGHQKAVLAAIKAGEIPVVRVGRKFLVPTAWVRRQLQLDEPVSASER